ncbi:DUF397 domain-containing protein [Streptomyces torulosus]|uniref:DUF397 domain-containing protein n=1 Tax=Streptomyces torulosus TaxID=68276 RepID=UPI0006EB2B64|nr:DUF397 domain-containing protein [Streptomyces torulosus]
MPDYDWQKSTFSPDASNCVHIATHPTGAVLLHESDTPGTVLTTSPAPFGHLIRALKVFPLSAAGGNSGGLRARGG